MLIDVLEYPSVFRKSGADRVETLWIRMYYL